MNEQIESIEDKEVNKDTNFIVSLANYYSEFLSTDFKKGSLPKRRIQNNDRKGRRIGINLSKYPSFITVIKKNLSKEFSQIPSIKIKPKAHKMDVPAVVRAAVDGEIKKINFDMLRKENEASVINYKNSIQKKDVDLEKENEKLITEFKKNISSIICSELINKLKPVFEKNSSNLTDALAMIYNDITDRIVSPIEDSLPTITYQLITEDDDTSFNEFLDENFNKNQITSILKNYFSSILSVGDLSSEIRDLYNISRLDDSLELYIYFGEVTHKDNSFPLFYMPFSMDFQNSEAELKFEPRILINKKAVDYVARIIQDETKTPLASAVDKRIIYVDPTDKILDKIDDIFEPILRAFQFNGDLIFSGNRGKLKKSSITVVNSFNFAVFDKSDESMLSDYEELLQKIDKEGGDLFNFISNLVSSFLYDNPKTIKNEILDEWDKTEISDRLVFDTPIPLAEEQRKIISALNHSSGRFITVEGPPGTGKSHTISAIAFGAILKGQSVMVLSDKNEALDVVENKLNETLANIRPSDDFVNPILRLGRVGTNFKKIISSKSINNLRTQHREIKKDQKARKKLYNEAVRELKNNIKIKSEEAQNIKIDEIVSYEEDSYNFKSQWEEKLGKTFIDMFESHSDDSKFNDELHAIDDLLQIRNRCLDLQSGIIKFTDFFGADAQSLAISIKFVKEVQKLASNNNIFIKAPLINHTKLSDLRSKILEIKSFKGIFGYLFSYKKINYIKDSIESLIGYRSTSILIDELIHDLENLLLRANKFYDDMNDFYENPYEFIPEALNIEFDSPFDSSLPGELKLLQDQINLGKIPFLDSSETILEVLTDPDNLQINDFYDPFVSIRKEKLHLEEQFKFTDYNYNVRKKEIESYNSLELATQIDERVINFADDFQNDAKTLSVIISKKKKFPKDKFDILKSAFPCIICSLRDYAEYIPLEREIFDLIIIDEASTVSIAQAFPAIIRAKKMIVLGDKKQFSNVKTSNASKEINNRRFSEVKKALGGGVSEFTSDLEIRIEKLNISNSILDFMENLSNFDIMLRKHFRGYPEMISFSSKYFYGNSLQAMKIRGKSIKDVLEFIEIKHSGNLDIYKNTNEQEINVILNRVLLQLEQGDYRTVAVLTPFTEQQILISKIFSEHEKYEEILAKLRFRSFTFDSCQGEERDIIYYSFVASPEKDHLKHILPKSIDRKNEEELDKDKKLKRINVAFSRGKEKLIFVHSKPISDFSGGREILNHYKTEIANAHILPTHADVDQNSEAEKRVLDWLIQSPMYMEYKPEIVPQFELGKYLKSLDQKYSHPMYRVDFLLRFTINNKQIDIVVEYDGFEYHFNNREEVDAGNWKTYLTDKDIEREHILESYGYKVIRLNKFNIGKDPIKTISDKIEDHINQDTGTYDALTSDVIDSTKIAHNGLQNGTYKVCKKCNSSLPIEKFLDHKAKTGIGRLCNNCKSSNSRKRYKKRYL